MQWVMVNCVAYKTVFLGEGAGTLSMIVENTEKVFSDS
jgi:hypothetical protein